MSTNRIKETWAAGRTAFGLWSTIPSSFSAELVANPGLDYVCVDQQHGIIDYDSMVPMLQAIGGASLAPITRVPDNEPWMIMKALDAGAVGVIVPLVNNAAEAERAVAACRYPPQGMRSYGPVRAAAVVGSRDPNDLADAVLCIVQVETREGLEKVEEIAATPGLDGIYVGPADLALALGLRPEEGREDPEHVEAVRRIRDACRQHHIAAGVHCLSGESAAEYAKQGFNLVTVGVDSRLLIAAVNREVATARGEPSEIDPKLEVGEKKQPTEVRDGS